MACAGIDFGSNRAVVAIARRGGVDICCNEVSNRSTPCLISFSGNQRFIGESAVNFLSQNPRNTVGALQRLLGAAFDAPLTQHELKLLPAQNNKILPTPTGGVAAQVSYNYIPDTADPAADDLPDATSSTTTTTTASFSFEALVGMLFSHLLDIASKEYGAPVRDCVVTVPSYYTDAQRNAILNAAAIGNINLLQVMNEHAAIALSYGIFRTKELPAENPVKVAFVDMGHASTSVTIASFTSSHADILCVVSDPCLGGRDFDLVVANVLSQQFKAKYKLDVMDSVRPRARLLKEAEKVKRILSANSDYRINIECLMNDVDVSGEMSRDEFEQLSIPLIDRLRKCCRSAIADAKLAPDEKLLSVEIIGAATRIPAVKAAVESEFEPLGASLKTTLNMDECIARGAALKSAMLSPAFKVREYGIKDIVPYAIDAVRYGHDGQAETIHLMPKYQTVPCHKKMTFRASGPVTISLVYKDPPDVPASGKDQAISSYKVEAPNDAEAKVRVRVRMNNHGLLEKVSAQLITGVDGHDDAPNHDVNAFQMKRNEMEELPRGAGTDTNDMATSMPADVNPTDAPSPGKTSETLNHEDSVMKDVPDGKASNASSLDNAAGAPGDSTSHGSVPTEGNAVKDEKNPSVVAMEDIVGVEKLDAADVAGQPNAVDHTVAGRRTTRKVLESDILVKAVTLSTPSLPPSEVKSAIELEAQLKATDLYLKERSEALNGLESYVYDLRSRIEESGDLHEFGPEHLRSALKSELDETEEWIYSDDGEKASKSAFLQRKQTFVEKAAPMLTRKRERDERPVVVSALESSLEKYKRLAVPSIEEYAHIDSKEKEKAMKCVEEAALWLRSEMSKQEKLSLEVDPVLTCAAVRAKHQEVDRVCGPIASTPKPAPPAKQETSDATESATEPVISEPNGGPNVHSQESNGDVDVKAGGK